MLSLGLAPYHATRAATLVAYNFTGSNDNATSVIADGSATALSIGVLGTEFGTVGDSLNGNGWSTAAPVNNPGAAASSPTRFIRTGNLTFSQADALTANDYFEFTFTPDLGFQADLTALSFDIAATSTNLSSITSSWFLRSSVNGFASDIGSIASVSRSTPSGTSNYTHFDIDMSSFQGLTGDVVFRLYTFASSSPSVEEPNRLNRIDNITLTGDIVVIPEPSAYAQALLGLGVLAALVWSRCKLANPDYSHR